MLFQLNAEIKSKEDAQQFLATVTTTDNYDNHPREGTKEDVLHYALIMESMATAKIGCYSGMCCTDAWRLTMLCRYFVKAYFKYFSLQELHSMVSSNILSNPEMAMIPLYIPVHAQKKSGVLCT